MDPSSVLGELRSLENTERAYVRFENKTGRSIDVIWINYNGEFVSYGILDPNQFMDVNTFKTHPWIFLDRSTGEKMRIIGNRTVYHPRSCREICERIGRDPVQQFRIRLPVFLPLYTLRRISIHAVLNRINDLNGLDGLELPAGLVNEIREFDRNRGRLLGLYASS